MVRQLTKMYIALSYLMSTQTLMNVVLIHITVQSRQSVLTLKVATTVPALLDTLGMEPHAIVCLSRWFELNYIASKTQISMSVKTPLLCVG